MTIILHIVFVFLIFLCSLPIQAIIALVLAVTSGRPIIFTQERMGKNAKPFTLYKFRTMKRGAHREQTQLARQNEADGPVFKIHQDPRFTVVGRFLAHTGLDELPQLYNVLTGDMALFGPRPLPISEVAKLAPWQKKRHTIKPGIISPWILNGYHTQTFDAWMKSDISYIQKKNWVYDMRLALRTVKFLSRLFLREIYTSLTTPSKE